MTLPVTYANLRTPQLPAANTQRLVDQITTLGFGATSWSPTSMQQLLVNSQGRMLTEFQTAQKLVAENALLDVATGDSLAIHAQEVYNTPRLPGLYTIGYVLLTDVANAGPYTFTATSTSYSVGPGGLRYNGLYNADTGGTSVTIPKGSTARIVVQSQAIGSVYATTPANSIQFFARGIIPGVSVTNPSNWLTRYTGLQQGTDIETDAHLQNRDRSKWGTLSCGSVAKAYQYWALTASQQVKKCSVYSNYYLQEPGRVDVILAGADSAVGADVVAAVQNYIAAAQIGGDRIPVTARCVVSSALQRNITITSTIYVQSAYNTPALQQLIEANVASYFTDLPIGGLVSRERIIEVLLYPAGLSAGVITDAFTTSPADDEVLAFNETASATVNLTLISV